MNSPLCTPRGGGNFREEEVPVDFRRYQRERYECYQGRITVEVNRILHSIIRNAMISGKTHFRLQTLRMPTAFTYVYHQKDHHTYPIYHAHTLLPIENTTARVRFNGEHVKTLLDWLREQGVHFCCTTLITNPVTHFGNVSLAGFIHIEGYLIPEDTDLREKPGPLLSLWNGVYTIKCLDESMVGEWNKRLLASFRVGASYCIICTLYLGGDYDVTPKNPENQLPIRNEYNVIQPRNHLTMQVLEYDWSLKEKFKIMLSWVSQLNYPWTLLCGWKEEEKRVSNWAYFTIMLDPLEKMY